MEYVLGALVWVALLWIVWDRVILPRLDTDQESMIEYEMRMARFRSGDPGWRGDDD